MKPHDEWLYKAENDLESAKYLLSSERILFDIIVYHSQQCAEKSLKSFLAYNNQKIEKTHSLIMLSKKCEKINNDFQELRDIVTYLNPYATVFRYPDNQLLPSEEETKNSIVKAEEVFFFVKKILRK